MQMLLKIIEEKIARIIVELSRFDK